MKSERMLAALALFMASINFAMAAPSRLKSIDFDEDLVEGMNRRPLDSLQSIRDRDGKRKKPHLYRKRASFRSEVFRSVNEAAIQR